MIYVYLRIKVNLLHVCSFALSLSVANLLLLILSCDKTSDCSEVKPRLPQPSRLTNNNKRASTKKKQSSHEPVSVLASKTCYKFYKHLNQKMKNMQ